MNAPHFDDESLSAALDGADEAAAAHLAGCADCQARSQALGGAAREVAAGTGPAPAGLADRAVAAALAAFDAERSAGRPVAGAAPAPAPAPAPEAPTVSPLRRPGGPAGDRARFDRRRRLPAWALGVAAALAAVLVAVPVLSSLGSGDDPTETAATARDDSTTEMATGTSGAVVDGGDLGEQTDQLALGALVAIALGEKAPAPSPPGQAAPTADAQSAAEAERAAAATAAAPAPALARADTPTTTYSVADPAAVTACERRLAGELGERLGTLVYRATLRWQGAPAVVLAYRVNGAGGTLDHQAFVMALDGCGILASQGF